MRLHLYQRGRIWWARGSQDKVKFRKSTRHTSKRKARVVADRWELELADPANFRADKATVSGAIDRWLREIRTTMNPETVRFYEVKIEHVRRLLGDTKLGKLTHDKVLAYVQKRHEEGSHPHSVHRELTALRLTLKSAKRANEFKGDPRDVIPRVKSGYVPGTDWVTPEQVWACIAHLPTDRSAVVAWCAATASDFSSIFTAQRSDVTDTHVLVRGTKTSTRKRQVPRIKVLAPFLDHALAYGQPGEMLFASWPNMPRDVRRACKRANVPGFTSRTLRRSVATWLVRAGVPYPLAAQFLGHGSDVMLRRVYGQMSAEAAGKLIDERFS